MSAISTSPAHANPGAATTPIFARPSVMVRWAWTAIGSGWPVSADSPDGMSTASFTPGAASRRSSTAARWPVTSRSRPVPSTASTTTRARSIAAASSSRSSAVITSVSTPPERS